MDSAQKHGAKPHGAKPLSFIVDTVPNLQPGRALDLACGRGRHFLPLHKSGFTILGVEKEEAHCQWLRKKFPFAEIEIRDVEAEGLPEAWIDAFDLVVMTYFLWRPLFPQIALALRPGGALLLETFHMENHRLRGKPRRVHFALAAGEAEALAKDAGLKVQAVDEGERGDVYTARLWAQKPLVGWEPHHR